MYDTSVVIDEILAAAGGIIAVYGIILGLCSCAGIVLFLLQGFGLYEMSKTLELKNPWLAFIPIVSVFSLGRVGQKYIKQDGTRSAKFGAILLCLYIVEYVLAIAFIVMFIVAIVLIVSNAESVIASDAGMTLQMFSSLIPVIILYFITMAVAIACSILYYIVLWRVYSIFDAPNATLFIVLSIFFNFLPPIFLFVIRKHQAKLTYNERMGIPEFQINSPIE